MIRFFFAVMSPHVRQAYVFLVIGSDESENENSAPELATFRRVSAKLSESLFRRGSPKRNSQINKDLPQKIIVISYLLFCD